METLLIYNSRKYESSAEEYEALRGPYLRRKRILGELLNIKRCVIYLNTLYPTP